jgi:hypothetical protein
MTRPVDWDALERAYQQAPSIPDPPACGDTWDQAKHHLQQAADRLSLLVGHSQHPQSVRFHLAFVLAVLEDSLDAFDSLREEGTL